MSSNVADIATAFLAGAPFSLARAISVALGNTKERLGNGRERGRLGNIMESQQ